MNHVSVVCVLSVSLRERVLSTAKKKLCPWKPSRQQKIDFSLLPCDILWNFTNVSHHQEAREVAKADSAFLGFYVHVSAFAI